VPVDRQQPPNEVREIGAPARRALTSAGLTTWDAVDATPDGDLLALHGVGPRALRLLREGSAGRE
jgi:hypothetical protein